MVRITGEYQGDLHCTVRHEPSGATFPTDAPKDNLGRGESFSPTDLVATALGSCITTTMAIAARKHNFVLPPLRFETTKEMSAELPRRIVRLATQIWMPIPEDHPMAQKLKAAGEGCPVHRCLDHSVEAPITFHWAK